MGDQDVARVQTPSSSSEDEDESEILEESPCGRWLKRREEVEQRDIPGIDATYLAMDTEEGVEVVWNEVKFSERKYFNAKQERISEVFDRLIQLEHSNIVKLHRYWLDKEVPRLIFITEYMSSGSLKQFLKKTKRNVIKMALPSWRRWCTQILSALSYLHTSEPTHHAWQTSRVDTIFISHNGLIKIGAVAPHDISRHVKTTVGDDSAMKHLYYLAPEVGTDHTHALQPTPSSDIYSFGICALEMAALEISPESGNVVTEQVIHQTIESLDNPAQRDFIRKCLSKNPTERPAARELLFHPVIFEVPSLKLFAAHVIIKTPKIPPEQLTEESLNRSTRSPDMILAEVRRSGAGSAASDSSSANGKEEQVNLDQVVTLGTHETTTAATPTMLVGDSSAAAGDESYVPTQKIVLKAGDAPRLEVEKFLEEVRNGVYPMFMVEQPRTRSTRSPLASREQTIASDPKEKDADGSNSGARSEKSKDHFEEESRRIINVMCSIKPDDDSDQIMLSLFLKMDDKINRQLSCEIKGHDTPTGLALELVHYGLINPADQDMIAALIADTISRGTGFAQYGSAASTSSSFFVVSAPFRLIILFRQGSESSNFRRKFDPAGHCYCLTSYIR